eukprot:TRINITY_DN21573_c0_g1_i1.p1 TRINITY_DN21573_c0_g1~~TRINITY_DN21573_c0_g1_i1.p1  ORF type:complete len:361 (+),score=43.82 TRINITY_DN21573_c0_g1_i1:96-1178(+)
MASIPTPISLLQFQCIYTQPSISNSMNWSSSNSPELLRYNVRFNSSFSKWNRWKANAKSLVMALGNSSSSDDRRVGDLVGMEKFTINFEKTVGRLRGTISGIPPVILTMKRCGGTNFAIGLCIAVAFLLTAVREIIGRKPRYNHHGSVADLVKRGQLRSDRRGISQPLKYDDPFNNPLVKVRKGNSTIEMCGKVYRLAPVTLTKEEESIHQKRRSRAYQWKRPTIFLKEGDAIPPDIDPDTIRWIPANHPFATTVSDIDETLAQNNVYQKDGVPYRIKAEHEALQRKLETLQSEQKLDKMVIDPGNIRDLERPFKLNSKLHEQIEHGPSNMQSGQASTSKSDRAPETSENITLPEELQKP